MDNNYEPTDGEIFPNKHLLENVDEVSFPGLDEGGGDGVVPVPLLSYTKYDSSRGWILSSGTCNAFELELHKQQGPLIDGMFDGRKYYVVDGEAVERPVMGLPAGDLTVVADGETELVINGLPTPTSVTLTGPVLMHGVTETGDVTLVMSLQGEYKVEFESFPYITETRKINAT
jgi:hypothetical protein